MYGLPQVIHSRIAANGAAANTTSKAPVWFRGSRHRHHSRCSSQANAKRPNELSNAAM